MALSLPYPSIVFVPLDILTAEELNQMAQNTEFISNQFPLAASAIGSGAITSDKINAYNSGDNFVKLGNLGICWGTYTINNVANETDTGATIPLPITFANTTYGAVVSPASWHAWRFASVYSRATNSISIRVMQRQGTAQNLTVSYLCVGAI